MSTAGPALERKGDVASYLSSLEPRSVFFVDEIHRLPRALEETFYPAMEDRRLPITVGQGAGARVVNLDLPDVHADRRHHPRRAAHHPAARPLRRDATGSSSTGPRSSGAIVRRSAGILDVEIDADGAEAIAARSRGTPAGGQPAAQARARLRRGARRGHDRRRGGGRGARPARGGRASASTASTARSCARSARSSTAGPVGLSTLAVAVGEEQDTVEDVYEPYLLQQGLIMRTPRGRVATPAAYEHLGWRLRGRATPDSLF